MTKIDKFLKVLLVIALSAYQMEHIAHVEGWKAAIIIEIGIVISSVLKANKPLTALLALSALFVLSFHFDGGFTLSIKAVAEILMAVSVPVINMWLVKKEPVGQLQSVSSEVSQKPQAKVSQSVPMRVSQTRTTLSQETINWIKNLGQEGLSLRKIQDRTGVSKSTIGRILQSA